MKRDYPTKPLAISLLIVAAFTMWYGSNYNGPTAKSADVSLSQFSAQRAIDSLRTVLGEEISHAAGTDQNRDVRMRLKRALESLGLEVEESPFQTNDVAMCNLMATLPGNSSRRPIVLATHYDSVEQGPGAGDAGSCVGALLEVARILSVDASGSASDRSEIVFLFTDGEEWVRGIGHGLNGAEHFVSSATELLDRDPLIVNFDARGAAGPSLMYETSRNNLNLMKAILPKLPKPAFTASSYVSVYDLLPNATDFTIFKEHGLEGVNFAFIDDPHRYHTPEDTIANLDARSVQHHGENALAMVQFLASHPTQKWDAEQNAVFFTVLGRFEVIYPERYAIWLALVVLLLQLIGISLSMRRKKLATAAFVSALFNSLVLLLIMGSLGFLAQHLDRYRVQSNHGFGQYDPYVVGGLWFLVFAMSVFVLRLNSKTFSESMWHGVWFLAAVFGLTLSILLPGFSYLFLATGIAPAVLGLFPFRKSRLSIIVVAIAAIILVPIGWQFGIALGPRMATVLSVLFMLILAPILPMLVPETPQDIRDSIRQEN